jgi:DNA-binding response OmpR family regulator
MDNAGAVVNESPQPCRVLVAEDHKLSGELLERTLQSWGYIVRLVENGTDALAIMESESPPEIALLDWMMPGLTGPEICTRLRQTRGRCFAYLVLLTARGQQAEIAHGMEAGADDYIVKPFQSDELRARLKIAQRILTLERKVAELTAAQSKS